MIMLAIDDLKEVLTVAASWMDGPGIDAPDEVQMGVTRVIQALALIIEKTEGTGATSIQLVGIIPSEILRRIEPRNRCKLCGVESLAGQACDECGYRSKSGGGER